jgi:metal-responsive CopG/Arc/MetJ family transcriptional regulator
MTATNQKAKVDNDQDYKQVSLSLPREHLYALDELVLERRKQTRESIKRIDLLREAVKAYLRSQGKIS